MEEIKKLIESKHKYNTFDPVDLCMHKITGAGIDAGNKIKITWRRNKNSDFDDFPDFDDFGYLFELPNLCQFDEADIFVHIPKPQNLDGKDAAPPVFMHLYDILTNEEVIKVTIID